MKKFILIISLVLVALVGFGQATPSGQLRVATNTTVFGQNIPIGTTLFVVADSSSYISVAPVASTLTMMTSYFNVPLARLWILVGSGGGTLCDTCGISGGFYIVQEFSEDSTRAVHGCIHRLTGIPIANTVFLALNGMELRKSEYSIYSGYEGGGKYANFYTLLPAFKYDRIKISYIYKIASQISSE